jgi:hypothetical protein
MESGRDPLRAPLTQTIQRRATLRIQFDNDAPRLGIGDELG